MQDDVKALLAHFAGAGCTHILPPHTERATLTEAARLGLIENGAPVPYSRDHAFVTWRLTDIGRSALS